MDKLSALFYPFSTPGQLPGLKLAALFFDEIFVLSPISVVKDRRFSDYYHELPAKLKREFGEGLFPEVDHAQVLDESVQNTLAFEYEAAPLVDRGVIHVVNPFDEMRGLSLVDEFRRIITFRASQADEEAIKAESKPVVASAAVLEPPDRRLQASIGLLFARVSALNAIMCDAAVLLESHYRAIPVTAEASSDRRFATQVLMGVPESQLPQQLLRRVRAGESSRAPSELEQHKKKRDKQSFEILREAMLENVPDFRYATFDEIAEIREYCKTELESLRTEMAKLAPSLEADGKDADSARAIVDTVRRDVTPVVNEIERKLKLAKQEWARTFLDKLRSVTTIATFVSTMYVGMPLSCSAIATFGVAGLQAVADSHYKTREVKASSGLSFLIDLRSKVKKHR